MNILKQLNEMAYQRRKVYDKFQENNEERIDHLMYIFFHRNEDCLNHWINELASLSGRSYRVKPRYKLLSPYIIYDLIWVQPKDMVNRDSIRQFLTLCHEAKGLPEVASYSYDNLRGFLDEFFDWLSSQLASCDYVSGFDEVIKHLLDRYPII